jgi:hypothetical protein
MAEYRHNAYIGAAGLMGAGAIAWLVAHDHPRTEPFWDLHRVLGFGLLGLTALIFLGVFLGALPGLRRRGEPQSFTLPLVSGLTFSASVAQNPPAATSAEPPSAVGTKGFRGTDIELPKFVSYDNPILDGYSFTECNIFGPAILLAVSPDNRIEASRFDGDPVSTLWIVDPEDRPRLTGVIGVKQCTFKKCRFRNVGLVVASKDLDNFRRGFGLPPENK